KNIKARIIFLVFLAALVLSLGSTIGAATEDDNSELMAEVFSATEANLGGIGSEKTLIITDIGSPAESYVFLDDFYSEFYDRDLLYTQNLLVVQNARNSPLWFAFFDKCSGNCTYIEVSYENES